MKLMHLLHLLGACASMRTVNPAMLRRGEKTTHLTAFRVGGSWSENVMLDKFNVQDILDQILKADKNGTGTHFAKVTKVKKSENKKYILCEWTSDVSKEEFSKVYEWNEPQYAALNQWIHTNTHPKIVVRNPLDDDTTTDIDESYFRILSIESFEWDNRPNQYRMVAIKVRGSKRNEMITDKNMKAILEYVLVNASDPKHLQIEIKKMVPDETQEEVERVGFVTKMTEAEISEKLKDFNYYPLNNWLREKFPKKILENGTTIASSALELRIAKIQIDFESDWYREYHSTRRGHTTHLTAFNVSGVLSETIMLNAPKMKELIENIIVKEHYRVESNLVTITKLRKSDNQKFILCEWMSDLSKDAFDNVLLTWTDAEYAELNQWARMNLNEKGASDMDESDFKILKMAPFEWDTREEGLQMVAIKLRGTEKNRVYEDINLGVLLEHVFADESNPNHAIVKIWKQVPRISDPNFQRVGFLTKIPLETILEKLDDMNYGPLNEWARDTFTVNKTVHELKIIKIENDFELTWYQEYLGQDWNMLSLTGLDFEIDD